MKAENRTDFLDRDQLRRYFEQGCKPSSEWGIGSEYENFLVDLDLIFADCDASLRKYDCTSYIFLSGGI